MDKVKALLVRARGPMEVIETDPTPKALQELLGGEVDLFGPEVGADPLWLGVRGEEVDAQMKPRNLRADYIAAVFRWAGYDYGDRLHGDVIFMGPDYTNVPHELLHVMGLIEAAAR